MTRLPDETDSPETLLQPLKDLRNGALMANNFEYAVLLSHVYAWMKWLTDNYEEIKSENKS